MLVFKRGAIIVQRREVVLAFHVEGVVRAVVVQVVTERGDQERQLIQLLQSARAENRRFWRLSALCAHTKAPYKTNLLRRTLRPLERPTMARTVQRVAAARGRGQDDRLHAAHPRRAEAQRRAVRGHGHLRDLLVVAQRVRRELPWRLVL